MSNDRLHEHFSALFEGTLDEGIAQQIRFRMESDTELKKEYSKFCSMMEALSILPEEKVELPQFLSTVITSKLEAAQSNRFSLSASSLISWFRPILIGGLSLALFVGTIATIRNNAVSPSKVQASMTGSTPEQVRRLDEITIDLVNGSPVLKYTSSGPKLVKISSYETGQLLKQFDVESKELVCPLQNREVLTSAFEITASGESVRHFIVIPGRSNETELKGSGDIVEFAKVIASRFDTTIHLRVQTLSPIQWDIQESNPSIALAKVIGSKGFSVSEVTPGLIEISSPR